MVAVRWRAAGAAAALVLGTLAAHWLRRLKRPQQNKIAEMARDPRGEQKIELHRVAEFLTLFVFLRPGYVVHTDHKATM
jgi:hypothetical protein